MADETAAAVHGPAMAGAWLPPQVDVRLAAAFASALAATPILAGIGCFTSASSGPAGGGGPPP